MTRRCRKVLQRVEKIRENGAVVWDFPAPAHLIRIFRVFFEFPGIEYSPEIPQARPAMRNGNSAAPQPRHPHPL